MIRKLMAGVVLATLAVTAIAPATVSASGSKDIVQTTIKVNDRTGLFDTLIAAAVCTPDTVNGGSIADTLAAVDGLTVFAPTDRAFRNLGRDLDLGRLNKRNVCDKLDNATRELVLKYHVFADGEVKYREARKLATRSGTPIKMLAGGDAELKKVGWLGLAIDGTSSKPSRVILPNVDASNGVIHVIDRVLLP